MMIIKQPMNIQVPIVMARPAKLTVQSTQVIIKGLQIITEINIPRLHPQVLNPSTTMMYSTFTAHKGLQMLRVPQAEPPQVPAIVQTLLVQFPAFHHNLSIQIVILNHLFLQFPQLLLLVPLQIALQALQVPQIQEALLVLQVQALETM